MPSEQAPYAYKTMKRESFVDSDDADYVATEPEFEGLEANVGIEKRQYSF
jgi:hypothetical protein